MSDSKEKKQATLKDEDIVSVKKTGRRRLLAQMGLVAAAGAATLLGSQKAHAYDRKRVDRDARDPDKD